MRVTDKLVFERAAREGNAAGARLEQARREVSTGLRVQLPEDDPGAAARVVGARAALEREEAVGRALGAAIDELGAADVALGGVGEAVSRARELAVQLANATYGAGERQGAAVEVEGLLAHVVGLLNTRSGHRYLFGGFQDQQPPFTAAGAYVGDTGVRRVELSPGVRLAASVRADVALGGAGGGVDVLATLGELAAALRANDVTRVQNTLTGLDAGLGQVALARAEAGALQATAEAGRVAAGLAQDTATTELAAAADADVLDAAARLALAERALDASLTASAKAFRLTLLDRL